MIAVPGTMPVTVPAVAFTTATLGDAEVQVPPLTLLLSVIVNPEHTDMLPEIFVGGWRTTTAAVV